MDNQAIVVECTYHASISKVWIAITDKTEMKKWYFDLAEFKAEPGFKFNFWGGTEDNQYLHLCEVTEVVPGSKLSYSWRYDGYAGNSLVTFELFEKEDRTLLKLTHKGLETFPGNPDFAATNFEQGWDHILNIALKDYLEPHS